MFFGISCQRKWLILFFRFLRTTGQTDPWNYSLSCIRRVQATWHRRSGDDDDDDDDDDGRTSRYLIDRASLLATRCFGRHSAPPRSKTSFIVALSTRVSRRFTAPDRPLLSSPPHANFAGAVTCLRNASAPAWRVRTFPRCSSHWNSSLFSSLHLAAFHDPFCLLNYFVVAAALGLSLALSSVLTAENKRVRFALFKRISPLSMAREQVEINFSVLSVFLETDSSLDFFTRSNVKKTLFPFA